MELWIRSQDKSSLVKVDNLYISVGNYICYYVEKGKEYPGTYYRPAGELGRYATKERALEVLDEIQDTLIAKYVTSLNPRAAMLETEEETTKALEKMAVYVMPKE